ncbi:13672_t:CDS:1, partial [Ambispora gerdemannii]
LLQGYSTTQETQFLLVPFIQRLLHVQKNKDYSKIPNKIIEIMFYDIVYDYQIRESNIFRPIVNMPNEVPIDPNPEEFINGLEISYANDYYYHPTFDSVTIPELVVIPPLLPPNIGNEGI